ncbi:MAG: N-acetylneuraminate synthase family protein [Desulfohalobiaceae bacterium]|nr:N-acetylneuraminate synthase family protein [Desulfohalobiaceae bacterium]
MPFHKEVCIEDNVVGPGHPVFIIAEAGVNHFGRIELAEHLIDIAVLAGADAVKFQIFKTENLISSAAPDWIRRMKSKELPYQDFARLQKYCLQKNIIFLATAHDEESFDFLVTLEPKAFKIGSGEIANPLFLQKIAVEQKPVILSTGMYTLDDVHRALDIFSRAENEDLILLHCNTAYPPQPDEINLRAIEAMSGEFACPIGYSDHNVGIDITLAAVAIGARVIEKHIALDRNAPGSQDCPVSCDQKGLVDLVNGIRRVEMALGSYEKKPSKAEQKSRDWARKSIVAGTDILEGQTIQEDMLVFKRPGTGISPELLSTVVGKKARRRIDRDTLLSLDVID